jgi:tRNA-splicing ligase RtcB
MKLVYDVAHNIAKFEEHDVDGQRRKLVVHRKGATRAFAAGRAELPSLYRDIGQPVILPGSMGTASYVMVGEQKGMEIAFGSTAHGAGRVMSRHQAINNNPWQKVQQSLNEKGIFLIAADKRVISEEAPEAYKDIDLVVDSVNRAGITSSVTKLIPLGVVKG